MMLKQLSILIILSTLLLVFSNTAQMVLAYLGSIHAFVNAQLGYIFNTSTAGNTTQEVASLMIIPLTIAGSIQAIYWIFKRTMMPHFYHILWTVWLILFTSITLVR